MSTALSCMYYNNKSKCTFVCFFCFCFIFSTIRFVYCLAPLQPLAINGREQRRPLQQQITSNLPPAASLQSLAPLADQQQSEHHEEKEKLLNDIQQLKNEVQKSKETIVRLQKSEEQMRER